MEFYIKAHNSSWWRRIITWLSLAATGERVWLNALSKEGVKYSSLVYTAKTLSGDEAKEYVGQTAITFKLRFNNHTGSS
jgi:hypothetical protein